MPIKLNRYRTKNLSILKCIGEVNFPETIEALGSFFKTPTKNCLWDMSSLDGNRWSSEEIKKISKYSAIHCKTPPEGKTAFAAPSDVDFGISRMYESFARMDGFPWEVRTFRSMNEALRWLGEGD